MEVVELPTRVAVTEKESVAVTGPGAGMKVTVRRQEELGARVVQVVVAVKLGLSVVLQQPVHHWHSLNSNQRAVCSFICFQSLTLYFGDA